MRILLLGASGYLGAHVHTRLNDDTALTVVPAGRSGDGVRVDLAAVSPGELWSVIRQTSPDVVVNCAGVTGGDPVAMAAGNVVAVANLIAALDRHGRPIRLVHLGSAAEYGVVPDGLPVPETAPARPVSPYGMSKLAGTELVRAARRHGRDATVLRVFNPIGPGTPGNLLPGRLVATLRRAAETGERAQVGNLDGYRDFVDARDVAAAVHAAATTAGDLPAVLNLGSGRATALRDLAGMAAGVAGVEPPLESAGGSANSATVTWQQADIGAIGAALRWEPSYPLDASLRDMGLPEVSRR
jgi:NDP-hexose 4-ketoreductase